MTGIQARRNGVSLLYFPGLQMSSIITSIITGKFILVMIDFKIYDQCRGFCTVFATDYIFLMVESVQVVLHIHGEHSKWINFRADPVLRPSQPSAVIHGRTFNKFDSRT